MKESAWEASRHRRRERKKALLYTIIIFFITAMAAVLVVNNAERIKLFGGRSESTKIDDKKGSFSQDSDITVGRGVKSLPSGFDSGETDNASSHPASSSELQSGKRETTSGQVPASDRPGYFSVELPSIQCRLENRKDMVIHLSLELFFNDIERRSAILFRREEIKIIVMRAVRQKALMGMKLGDLEKELLSEIKGFFGDNEITAVKIRNIQIEKADK